MLSSPPLNQLLGALPASDWQTLRPLLEAVDLPAGTSLYEAGSALTHAYFPCTAVISLTATMQDGGLAEVAVVGSQGLVGVCAYMGVGNSLSSAVVQHAGQALRISAPALREAARVSAPLMRELLRYTQVLFTQMAQTSACSRHHGLDQQLCRWLLLHLDRVEGSEMQVTHERIANMLGVRREGVTVGALKLQKAGLIHYVRGRLSVLDRAGIEERCCECYGVVRNAYDGLERAQEESTDFELEMASRFAPNAPSAAEATSTGMAAPRSQAGRMATGKVGATSSLRPVCSGHA
jgi:CRP-like cAMP-binding protein